MSDDQSSLTPDGWAYARFLSEASVRTGLAVSNAVMYTTQAIASDLHAAACCPEYTQAHRDEDYEFLRNLFPVVRALQPVVAGELSMEFPFLWDTRATT